MSGYARGLLKAKETMDESSPTTKSTSLCTFPEIKEAFYAKCAVLFEGETEYGCISAFAEKIGVLWTTTAFA